MVFLAFGELGEVGRWRGRGGIVRKSVKETFERRYGQQNRRGRFTEGGIREVEQERPPTPCVLHNSRD
jgi:hypothetical protein